VTEAAETSTWQATADEPSSAAGDGSPQERVVQLANDRPELAAGAAFAGGLVLAMILKRLGR
jgi:hypothetical protein